MKWALLMFILLFFIGTASATDYYVATYGDNSNNGLTVNTPKADWSNSWFNSTNINPGDTIYCISGTWEGEYISFDYFQGNAGNYITLTKYNGTAILNNSHIGASGTTSIDSYINISNITISNYVGKGIYFRYSDNINIKNVEIFNTTSSGIHFLDVTRSSIIDSHIHDNGWNSVMVQSNYHDVYDILIENNTIHDSSYGGSNHNTLDFFNYDTASSMHDVIIRDNHIYEAAQQLLFFHTDSPNFSDFQILNNILHDSDVNGYVCANYLVDSVFEDNIVYNSGIRINSGYSYDNVTYWNTTVYSPNSADFQFTLNLDGSPLRTHTSINGNSSRYRSLSGCFIIQDCARSSYNIRGTGTGITAKYTDGSIFTEPGTGAPRYYPTHSNWTTAENTDRVITKKSVTLKPSTGYLKDVVLNTYDLSNDIYNVTINSSVAESPTWINVTVANASDNYSVKRDGISYDYVESDVNSIARYYYNVTGDEWSSHSFEFTWASSSGGGTSSPYIFNSSTSPPWINTSFDSNTTIKYHPTSLYITLDLFGTDNMDSYTVNSDVNTQGYWEITGTDASNYAKFITDPSDASNQVIRYEESGDSVNTHLYYNKTDSGYSKIIEFDFEISSTSGDDYYIQLYNQSGLATSRTVAMKFQNDFKILSYDGSAYVEFPTPCTWSTGNRKTYRIEYFNSTHYELFIDDVSKGKTLLRYPNTDGHSNISFNGYKTNQWTAYIDNIHMYNESDKFFTPGNVTHWHDAGTGNQTASFIVNMTTPANTNYTVWYADNGSSFAQIGGIYTGNQTPSISGTKYQNTDLRIVMNGNDTATPVEIEVTFVTEAGGVPDTKFEYYNGTGWQEGESEYYLWFTCFWHTAECANDEQSDSQATLKIHNNGTASGTPKMKLNESVPAGIEIYVDDDNTFAGAVELTNTYQAVSSSLSQDTNVTLWAWANLSGASAWDFETYAIVE